MDDAAAAAVIHVATDFATLITSIDEGWSRAYLLFVSLEGRSTHCKMNGSYVCGSEVRILDYIQNHNYLRDLAEQFVALSGLMGRNEGATLLCVSIDDAAQISYRIHFDDNPDRWVIDRLDGHTGIPDVPDEGTSHVLSGI